MRRYIKAGALRAAKIGAAQMITEGAIKDYLNGYSTAAERGELFKCSIITDLQGEEGEKEQPREKDEEPGRTAFGPKAKKAQKQKKSVKNKVAKQKQKRRQFWTKTQKEGSETPAKPLQQKKAKQMITQDLGDGWAVTYNAAILDK